MRLELLLFVATWFRVTLALDRCQVDTIKTCFDCISTPGCAWCVNQCSNSRCGAAHDVSWCGGTIYDDSKHELEIVQNEELGTSTGTDVQIKPQRISIKAKPGQVVKFQLDYAPATASLDVFLLMDVSGSMSSHREKVLKMAKNLVEEMGKEKTDLNVGFGTFVDKEHEKFGGDPITYAGFQNHLSLTSNTEKLFDSIIKANISGGGDGPEGGFDALMQVMVCENKIGWRSDSLRVVVFITDAESHVAGDGQIAGITKPNDERCHMNIALYTEGLNQDYPSVAQISKNALKYKVNIIFAVTSSVKSNYAEMKIHNSQIAELSEDSTNVVEMIKDYLFQAIETYLLPEEVDISLTRKCRHDNQLNSECESYAKNKIVSSDVELKVKSCPSKRLRKIYVSPPFKSERLEIDLQVECECNNIKKETMTIMQKPATAEKIKIWIDGVCLTGNLPQSIFLQTLGLKLTLTSCNPEVRLERCFQAEDSNNIDNVVFEPFELPTDRLLPGLTLLLCLHGADETDPNDETGIVVEQVP